MIRLAALMLFLSPSLFADSLSRDIGREFGQFGAGVSDSVVDSFSSRQPHWVTVSPKSKPECLLESAGALNPVYVRCINGYQKQVTVDSGGKERVISERSIPMNLPR